MSTFTVLVMIALLANIINIGSGFVLNRAITTTAAKGTNSQTLGLQETSNDTLDVNNGTNLELLSKNSSILILVFDYIYLDEETMDNTVEKRSIIDNNNCRMTGCEPLEWTSSIHGCGSNEYTVSSSDCTNGRQYKCCPILTPENNVIALETSASNSEPIHYTIPILPKRNHFKETYLVYKFICLFKPISTKLMDFCSS